jgi:hypothetical protein
MDNDKPINQLDEVERLAVVRKTAREAVAEAEKAFAGAQAQADRRAEDLARAKKGFEVADAALAKASRAVGP